MINIEGVESYPKQRKRKSFKWVLLVVFAVAVVYLLLIDKQKPEASNTSPIVIKEPGSISINVETTTSNPKLENFKTLNDFEVLETLDKVN